MSNCSKTNASSVLSVSLSKSSLRVPKRDGRHTGGVWKNVFFRRLTFCVAGVGSRDEERLVRDLFRGYNKLIRPVENMTQKVEVAFGLAFIQLINVVSISSSSFSSFAMIPLMELLGGKPAWQLFFIISNCVKTIVYEQMSNDRMNKEENKVIFAIHQAQG